MDEVPAGNQPRQIDPTRFGFTAEPQWPQRDAEIIRNEFLQRG
jgi:hypothetical protein